MNADALKVTVEHVRKALMRLALHYPRSRQIESIDVLAVDYAHDCKAMTVGQFDAAVAEARARSKYWPTSAEILAAHERLEEAARVTALRAVMPKEEVLSGSMSEEDRLRNLSRVRELRAALSEGRRPAWMQ